MSGRKSKQQPIETKASGIGTWLIQMAAVAAISVTGYHFTVGAKDAEAKAAGIGATSIVVIDTQRLLEAKIEMATKMIAQGAEMTQEDMEMQGNMFGTKLLQALKDYRDQGTIVLDRRHALAIPPEYDITEKIAAQMGLTVKPFNDPFSAPSLN